MTASSLSEAQRLRRIRARLDGIAPGHWLRAADGEGDLVEAFGEMRGERIMLCRFSPYASEEERDFIVDAPGTVRFLLALLDRAIRKLRTSEGCEPARNEDGRAPDGQPAPPEGQPRSGGQAREAKNFAAEAAMKCAEPGFKKFLEEAHGLERPLTDERAAQKVRSLCGVTSRRELNDDAKSAASWRDLVRQFDAWRKRG